LVSLRSIIVQSMRTSQTFVTIIYISPREEWKSTFHVFFFSYTTFLHSLSSMHLRRLPRVKVQRIPLMDICSDFRYRWVIRFSITGQRAFTYPDSFSNVFIPAICRAWNTCANVYLAFLTELINCIKRTRSTILCVRFSSLRIRINYFGTI